MPTDAELEEMTQKLYSKRWEYCSGAECLASMNAVIAYKQAKALADCAISLHWLSECVPAAIRQKG